MLSVLFHHALPKYGAFVFRESERLILAQLAEFEIERLASVHDSSIVVLEPEQCASRVFRGAAVASGVGGGTHTVVEHTLGRRFFPIEEYSRHMPLGERNAFGIKR